MLTLPLMPQVVWHLRPLGALCKTTRVDGKGAWNGVAQILPAQILKKLELTRGCKDEWKCVSRFELFHGLFPVVWEIC